MTKNIQLVDSKIVHMEIDCTKWKILTFHPEFSCLIFQKSAFNPKKSDSAHYPQLHSRSLKNKANMMTHSRVSERLKASGSQHTHCCQCINHR